MENALRHTPEGTTVSIVVQPTRRPSASSITGPACGRIKGMRSFAASGRAAAIKQGGAGLGLDIAARTVVAHGGIISVDDAPDGGAIFTMQFEALPGGGPELHFAFREHFIGPA